MRTAAVMVPEGWLDQDGIVGGIAGEMEAGGLGLSFDKINVKWLIAP